MKRSKITKRAYGNELDTQLRVRMSAADREQLEKRAASAGVSLSDWARTMLVRAARRK